MPVRVSFHRLAQAEAQAAEAWYAVRSHAAAERFRRAVEEAAARCAANPDVGTLIGSRFRAVRVWRFPYVLVHHRLDVDEVQVVAVAHTSRRPGYWRRRN